MLQGYCIIMSNLIVSIHENKNSPHIIRICKEFKVRLSFKIKNLALINFDHRVPN